MFCDFWVCNVSHPVGNYRQNDTYSEVLERVLIFGQLVDVNEELP